MPTSGAATCPPTGPTLPARHDKLHACLCTFQYLARCSVLTSAAAPVQAVPTVLGATWGMIWTTLVLPQYGSDKMLALQAACLRGTFGAITRCRDVASVSVGQGTLG